MIRPIDPLATRDLAEGALYRQRPGERHALLQPVKADEGGERAPVADLLDRLDDAAADALASVAEHRQQAGQPVARVQFAELAVDADLRGFAAVDEHPVVVAPDGPVELRKLLRDGAHHAASADA